jgi:hypothetical protein
MFDRLKGLKGRVGDATSGAAYQALVDAITPKIAPVMEQVRQLAPEYVTDDAKYRSHVVEPAWLAIAGMTSGAASLIPNLHDSFVGALFHARAELIVVDAGSQKVSLAEGAMDRLPQVLLEGFRKPLA